MSYSHRALLDWPSIYARDRSLIQRLLVLRIISIVKYTIRNFLLHISIAKPLSEGGKLQMASDMTELEFALNAFMAENNQAKRGDNLQSLGEEYRALRAMR